MRSFWTDPAILDPTRMRQALAILARECRGILAPLSAYVGALALLAIGGISFWNQLPAGAASEPTAKAAWAPALRWYPAFAISQSDLPDKTNAYEIFRHPEGGRKDVFRWADKDATHGQRPIAELEIYRPGGEFSPTSPAAAELATRMVPEQAAGLEPAGFLDSKFGLVTLVRQAGGTDEARFCLGFIKPFDEPRLRISGWSCQGDTVPARRAAIGCMLSRLILLTAGNTPKLAELFAHAELRRGSCAYAASSAQSADWLTTAQNPGLRGAF